MTTFSEYLSQIKPIPGFDSKKWLRKVRAEIQRENEGLTDEQIRERELQSSEYMRKECEQYWAERAKAESADN
jgi:hypothetical protein